MRMSPRLINAYAKHIGRLQAEEDLRLINALMAASPNVPHTSRKNIVQQLQAISRGEQPERPGLVISGPDAVAEYVQLFMGG